MNIKERTKKIMTSITRTLAYALTAIAGVAISWFSIESFDSFGTWYSLPIIAIFTGLITLIIPWWGKSFFPAYTVTSTGLAIFLILIANHYFTSDFAKVISTFIIITLIGILSDVILTPSRATVADIALDAIICLITTICVVYLSSTWSLIVIIIAYWLVLTIQFKPDLFKRHTTE